MENKDRICLGAIVGVHGIRGEVKVKSFTENERDIAAYGEVEDKSGLRKFQLKIVGHSKELLRVKIAGVDDRNQAEELIGTGFYVSKSVLPALAEEEFYHADLIGLALKESASGTEIGKVEGLYNFGAGDLIDIRLKGKKSTEMLPFNRQYVPEINIKDGYIIVTSLEDFAEDQTNESSDAG